LALLDTKVAADLIGLKSGLANLFPADKIRRAAIDLIFTTSVRNNVL